VLITLFCPRQFMTSKETRDGDIFRVLDAAVHKLRQFASACNVHITLVIHPRKDDESQLLTLASVFGSAKATQESDNVIILQNNGIVKYLDVRKNRCAACIPPRATPESPQCLAACAPCCPTSSRHEM